MKTPFFGIFLLLLVRSQSLPKKPGMEDKFYWLNVGSSTLDTILNRRIREGVAKNLIVFVGDGMGLATVTMARIYQGQMRSNSGENNVLAFEKFPSVGLAKTYDASHQVADSASTATAIFSGVKVKQSVIGLDATAEYKTCDEKSNALAKVSGIMTWAQEKGKHTGIVTTARVTHATPAGTYAHINDRDWECDGAIPSRYLGCVKDIARQLVEDEPGRNFKVILGGGRQQFVAVKNASDNSCTRKDGRNLVDVWKKGKPRGTYLETPEELATFDPFQADHLLGLFAPGHLKYLGEKDPSRPSLKSMTETAIRMLSKSDDGFALMVEGARIDMAHHDNYAKLALVETVEFDEAVAAAVNMTNPDDTLIVVTADHSHSATMSGYPTRGTDILGLAEDTGTSFFETFSYVNGPGYEYHHPTNQSFQAKCTGTCSEVESRALASLRDIRKEPEREKNVFYRHFSGHHRNLSTHGGEDVAVYASGPMAHLFVGAYEQNYIATAMSYASCIGPMANRCTNGEPSSSAHLRVSNSVFALVSLCLGRIRLWY